MGAGGEGSERNGAGGPLVGTVHASAAGAPTQQSSASTSASLLAEPRFQPFLAETFDCAEFASAALRRTGSTAVEQAGELQAGIRVLGDQIRDEVTTRYDELLAHSSRLKESEASLQGVRLGVESLRGSVDRVTEEIMEPYSALQAKTHQLGNLLVTADLLRHVIQRLKMTAKLRQTLQGGAPGAKPGGPGPSLDLAKAAKFLTDAKQAGEEVDLAGIDVLSADDEFLEAAEDQLAGEARAVLVKGMASLSQAEVGSALQVYYNLQRLRPAVLDVLEQYGAALQHSLGLALDARKLQAAVRGSPAAQGSSGPAASNAAAAEEMWSRLNRYAEELHGATVAVWHLQRVLAKKRDPLTHQCFEDVVLLDGEAGPAEPLLDQFWSQVLERLGAKVGEAAMGRDFVREGLAQGYPKLAALLEGTAARLARDTDVKGTPSAATEEDRAALLGATRPFMDLYLSSVTRRLSEAVGAAFHGNASRPVPSASEVQRLVGRFYDELKAASASEALSIELGARVGEALALLGERASHMAAAGPELRQLGGAATAQQQRNVALCSALQEVFRAVTGLLQRLPPAVGDAMRGALEAVRAAAVEAVAPIFRAAVEAAEQRVLSVHSEPFGSESAAYETATSPFVAELARLLAYFRAEFVGRFSPAPSPSTGPTFASALVERMACRLLVFFVRHASMLRPLSQAGKLRLAKDVAELEASVAANLCPLEPLGAPYRMLRAFRPLLFQDSAALEGSPLLKELPPAVVLQHLYSRAPAALRSPMQLGELSPAQWSAWLDQHSGEEAVQRIVAAIRSSKAAAEPEDGAQVISLMLRICDSAYGEQAAAAAT